MLIKLLKIGGADLRKSQALGYHSRGRTRKSQFNRALRKLYNELTRERETELNKAREEAKEIVDMALSESDRILQGLHAKSQLKPHEIIEAKAQLEKNSLLKPSTFLKIKS